MADNVEAFSPAKLVFESVWNRRRIIASYWVVILLALPLWWNTTSIERLGLPVSRVKALEEKELRFPVLVDNNDAARHYGERLNTDVAASIQQVANDQGVDVKVSGHVISASSPGEYKISVNSEGRAVVRDRELVIGDGALDSRAVAEMVKQLIVPFASRTSSEAHRVVKYAPHFRLAFTLLNEDASSGHGALSWELENSVRAYIRDTLDGLSALHNFTVESQVQYHAPLAFAPRALEVDGQAAHGLTQEDLTVFVNSAEWTLSSSVSNDPVLHFVLFVPSANDSPLYILDHEGHPTPSDAFILPQWGGVVLLNKPTPHLDTSQLHVPFTIFRHQLLSLLGVPSLPTGVHFDGPAPFSDWQLDALVRHRARENTATAKETLRSIIALVNQIENMPVGQDVRGDVQGALAALDNALGASGVSSTTALKHSSVALTLSSRAFFNPGMLALLYFPAEHKYAVYTPLFASVAAPLVAAVVRELVAWRKARRITAAAAQAAVQRDGRQHGRVD